MTQGPDASSSPGPCCWASAPRARAGGDGGTGRTPASGARESRAPRGELDGAAADIAGDAGRAAGAAHRGRHPARGFGRRGGPTSASTPTCFDLGSLEIEFGATDVSALAGCTALHTLTISYSRVTDVSTLAGLAALHTLNLAQCDGVTDVCRLAGCAALHILVLSHTRVSDVSALGACAALHTLVLRHCRRVTDVSACGLRESAQARPLGLRSE